MEAQEGGAQANSSESAKEVGAGMNKKINICDNF